jgi:2-oxoisovalerate dehydrogenase E1 component alpha subunit
VVTAETHLSETPTAAWPAGVVRVLRDDGTADPATDPKVADDVALAVLRHMIFARAVDERLVTLQRQGKIGFHASALGEEAAIVASAAALRARDWIFPAYREHAAALWRGMSLEAYLHHMLGTALDPAKGRQMPDHFTARAARCASVSSPVGTQLTHAVGFAWGARIRRDDVVVLAHFGEGTTSSGDFHTGMNFAGVFRAPVVFFCRNNGHAPGAAGESFAEKAVAYGVEGVRCDGNDALAVYRVTRDAVARAASGKGATLVEAITHRWEDVPHEEWRARDPVYALRRHLERKALWSAADQDRAERDAETRLAAALATVEAAAPPALATLFDDVYATVPPHLAEQLEAARALRKER